MPLAKPIRFLGKAVELKSACAVACNFPQELNKASSERAGSLKEIPRRLNGGETRLMLHEPFG